MIAIVLAMAAAEAPMIKVEAMDLGVPVAALATGEAAPAPAPPERMRPRPAYPRTMPGSWVTKADYPAEALAARQTGWTQYALLVGADGRPQRCKVMDSSGSDQLDIAACKAALNRAQFWPALDQAGRAVPTVSAQRVRWALPVLAGGGTRVER